MRFALEIAVFVCGALVMIYEITGSRILAPFIGTSTYVWTSLIGVILAALSLGYWIGGRVADRRPDIRVLAGVVFAAGGAVGLTILVQEIVLSAIASLSLVLEIKSVAAAVLLFAPASVLLGFVSPYAVRLRMQSVGDSGATVGRLYALSTVGSIAGTFLSGFVLIPFVGSIRTLYFIAAALFGVSMLLAPLAVTRKNIAAVVLFVLAVGSAEVSSHIRFRDFGLVDQDTEYSRVRIFRASDPATGRPVRVMTTDPRTTQSTMFLDGDGLTPGYLEYYHLISYFNPRFERVLMIGGAGYSFPKEFLRTYPDARIDVVEIDPGMTRFARRYFGLQDDPRLRVIHQDGRAFLNGAPGGTYDAVLIDAFTALFTIPFHLTTVEAVSEVRRVLKPGGSVILNVGGALEGPNSGFFLAELAVYRSIFPEVDVFRVNPQSPPDRLQNLVIAARTTAGGPSVSDERSRRLLANRMEIPTVPRIPLTDDLAPVEYLNSGAY